MRILRRGGDRRMKHNLSTIACNFQILGEFSEAAPYGSGHINDTYCVVFNQGGMAVRYIFQRINHLIFKDPVGLMDNIQRVTSHLQGKLEGERSRRALFLIPARDGKCYYRDGEGNTWRAYIFVEKARTYDAVESTKQAFEAARAFGRFQCLLADLPAPRLKETIPDFHHTPKRFAALERAIEADVCNRAELARAEIEFVMRRKPMVSVLLNAGLPERVTHNDTKFNNVMLDDATGEGICVIDLDTVMPGLALYDFGDMVRTTTSPAREALVRGYLATSGDVLTAAEKQHLAFSGRLITLEIGIRFLTDLLMGDTYFKIHRENHNLDRCRTQLKLVESMEHQEDQMNRLVASLG
jgi:Phosphotransferase enzyme family